MCRVIQFMCFFVTEFCRIFPPAPLSLFGDLTAPWGFLRVPHHLWGASLFLWDTPQSLLETSQLRSLVSYSWMFCLVHFWCFVCFSHPLGLSLTSQLCYLQQRNLFWCWFVAGWIEQTRAPEVSPHRSSLPRDWECFLWLMVMEPVPGPLRAPVPDSCHLSRCVHCPSLVVVISLHTVTVMTLLRCGRNPPDLQRALFVLLFSH